jgi:hypothetical protein
MRKREATPPISEQNQSPATAGASTVTNASPASAGVSRERDRGLARPGHKGKTIISIYMVPH